MANNDRLGSVVREIVKADSQSTNVHTQTHTHMHAFVDIEVRLQYLVIARFSEYNGRYVVRLIDVLGTRGTCYISVHIKMFIIPLL